MQLHVIQLDPGVALIARQSKMKAEVAIVANSPSCWATSRHH
jgi:hypothetical protein